MADSDSDDMGNSPKKTKVELTVKEKEERFLAAAKISTEYDTMVSSFGNHHKGNTITVNLRSYLQDIQDALVRCNWTVSEAVVYLREKCTPKNRGAYTIGSSVAPKPTPVTVPAPVPAIVAAPTVTSTPKQASSANGSSKHTSKHRKPDHSDSEADDSGDEAYSKDQVYDSEDSDAEGSKEMTGQRKKVFEFMNTASLIELQTVKTLSEKKASLIVDLRPFKDWADLRQKLVSNKALSADLLNNAQELINKQNNVANILTKCNKLVQRLESAIEAGAGIVEQPKILNEKFKLADYQLIGLNWLTVMNKQQMNGILADEMGLGKTIQIIAFLAYLKENNLSKAAHLIVVPSSTLDNWAGEISRWCPSLIVEKYHGSQEERRRMRFRFAKEGFTGFDILLTT